MTPEERARYLAKYFVSEQEPSRREFMREEVLKAIRAAVAAEREACILAAKQSLLDRNRPHIGFSTYDALVCECLAVEAAIRARGDA